MAPNGLVWSRPGATLGRKTPGATEGNVKVREVVPLGPGPDTAAGKTVVGAKLAIVCTDPAMPNGTGATIDSVPKIGSGASGAFGFANTRTLVIRNLWNTWPPLLSVSGTLGKRIPFGP